MISDQIKVEIVADSVTPEGVRITTALWDYPRFIHGEVMTHRSLSKNASSSRAIPAKKVREQVWNRPAMPVAWGQNKSGMQAKKNLRGLKTTFARCLWKGAARTACVFHKGLEKVGLHKQLCNRILEPWMMMRIVITGTEWANFFWLRDHKDAQPEFQALAQAMYSSMISSQPRPLSYGEWHLPFVTDLDTHQLKEADLLALSVSCCAQTSYRLLDRSIVKALRIDRMLRSSSRLHASPYEHQAKCVDMRVANSSGTPYMAKQLGFTHKDVYGQLWSGNLRGLVQHRQTLTGHDMNDMATYIDHKEAA